MTEQRLIDANALRKRMYHDAFETDTDMQKWDSGCWIRYKMFENAIDDAQTIEERKKGKWMVSYLEHEAMGIRPKLLYCSECCQCIAYSTNFCPNCGAYMRGTP